MGHKTGHRFTHTHTRGLTPYSIEKMGESKRSVLCDDSCEIQFLVSFSQRKFVSSIVEFFENGTSD